MSRGATLSILGLYQYDNTILNVMQLPAGVERQILIPDLLSELAEFECLYPDPGTFKIIMRSWSRHRSKVWEKIYKASVLDYDPIENYDRREEWTDTGTASGSADQYTAGYNPNTQDVEPEMVKQAKADSQSGSTGTHTGRVHGNIGVTTSQQMLEQEIAVAGKLDVYTYIIQDVKRRFCLPLY